VLLSARVALRKVVAVKLDEVEVAGAVQVFRFKIN
jgi:hypothetical protein